MEKACAYLSVSYSFVIELLSSGEFWLGILIGILLLVGPWLFILHRKYRATKVTLNLPFNLGNVIYEATDEDRVLAWKMYVQLKTRKAALPFDKEHDVIVNVFDSLHEIFSVTRDQLSEASPHHGEAQKSIADLLLRVLNDGIRPTLTRWHATYRMWWSEKLNGPENKGKSPQEIQRMFPQYSELTEDLTRMNGELTKYAEELLIIVHTKSAWFKDKEKARHIKPEQPTQQSDAIDTKRAAELPEG